MKIIRSKYEPLHVPSDPQGKFCYQCQNFCECRDDDLCTGGFCFVNGGSIDANEKACSYFTDEVVKPLIDRDKG